MPPISAKCNAKCNTREVQRNMADDAAFYAAAAAATDAAERRSTLGRLTRELQEHLKANKKARQVKHGGTGGRMNSEAQAIEDDLKARLLRVNMGLLPGEDLPAKAPSDAVLMAAAARHPADHAPPVRRVAAAAAAAPPNIAPPAAATAAAAAAVAGGDDPDHGPVRGGGRQGQWRRGRGSAACSIRAIQAQGNGQGASFASAAERDREKRAHRRGGTRGTLRVRAAAPDHGAEVQRGAVLPPPCHRVVAAPAVVPLWRPAPAALPRARLRLQRDAAWQEARPAAALRGPLPGALRMARWQCAQVRQVHGGVPREEDQRDTAQDGPLLLFARPCNTPPDALSSEGFPRSVSGRGRVHRRRPNNNENQNDPNNTLEGNENENDPNNNKTIGPR